MKNYFMGSHVIELKNSDIFAANIARYSRFRATGLPPPWQRQQYQSGIPASFTEPPTLKRDGPKQTRERAAETVLLE